jgi:hypothetical protein
MMMAQLEAEESSSRSESRHDDHSIRRRPSNQSNTNETTAPQTTLTERLFLAMTRRPYPFLVALPFLFSMLICLGFSRPSILVDDISNIWIPTGGTYKKDKEYAERIGANNQHLMSTFAAMALSRHGDNLFTEDNLNIIVERMKRVESTSVRSFSARTKPYAVIANDCIQLLAIGSS